jgi:hypothetical protein
MSAPKHTPGPWIWESDRGTGGYVVWTRQPHTGELAHVLPEDINGEWPAKANALLMAAAPDLLEALLTFIEIGDCKASRQEAEAAITKATEGVRA